MKLEKYFIENFNPLDYEIKASIFDESTNSNKLSFTIKPNNIWIQFQIYNSYNDKNELIRNRRKVHINSYSTREFLGEYSKELERKLTLLLENKEFIDKLNQSINKEKQRIKQIYEYTLSQREVEE